MYTKATLTLDKRRATKKGYPVKILVRNGKKKYVPTPWYAFENEWKGEGPTTKHPNYRLLKVEVNKRKARLDEEVLYCIEHNLNLEKSVEVIKNGIDDKQARIDMLKRELMHLQGQTETMLLEFWEGFIIECRDKGLDTRALEGTKDQVEQYLITGDIPINNVNYELLNDFSRYKLKDGCGRGGLNSYLKTFRRVYLAAQRHESLNIKAVNPFKGIIRPAAKKNEIVEMTPSEMNKFKNYVPNKFTGESAAKSAIMRRDLWLFQFYIGGHDFVDVALLTWKQYRDGRLRFRRFKNRQHKHGGPLVDNLVIPQAKEIICAYGTPEKERIFGFIPHPVKSKTSYSHYINNTRRTLRAISVQEKLKDVMKTKSTRYIFKTWGDKLQVDERALRQIQGHEQIGVSALYGARIPNELVDKTLKRIALR